MLFLLPVGCRGSNVYRTFFLLLSNTFVELRVFVLNLSMFLYVDQPAYHTHVGLTGSMLVLMQVMSMLFTFNHLRCLVSPYTGIMLLICKW